MEGTREKTKESYLKNECTFQENRDFKIYIPKMTETFTDEENQIQKLEVGQRNINVAEKVIMIVGATGAGKSSFINTAFNHIVGVKWEDEFRVKLIEEESAKSQAHSQTKMITAYTIHHRPHFTIPYTVTLIDTPGYGAPEGLKRDKEITSSIEKFFKTKGIDGIDQLDAIGFAVPSTMARLTPTQQYIFDSILALFGKDMAENIFMLVTFADGQQPEVLSAIKEGNMPFHSFLEVNSWATYTLKATNDDESNLNEEFWTTTKSSFHGFVSKLYNLEARSLILTQKVLKERKKLDVAISGIHRNIKELLYTLERLSLERDISKRCQTEIDEGIDVSIETSENMIEEEPTVPGENATNCTTCKMTCHAPCPISSNDKLAECLAMNNEHCNICPGRCHWSYHKSQPFMYTVKTQSKTQTIKELAKIYQTNKDMQLTSEKLISRLTTQMENTRYNILTLAEKAIKSIAKLDRIALRPSPLATVDYIDQLIIYETDEGKPRWKERVQQLQQVKWQAEYIQLFKQTNLLTQLPNYGTGIVQHDNPTKLSLLLLCQGTCHISYDIQIIVWHSFPKYQSLQVSTFNTNFFPNLQFYFKYCKPK